MTKTRRSLALIMVDALRHDYIDCERMPFIAELSREGRAGRLLPPVGFEPDDAIFAGLSPAAADAGAQFWLDAEASPFQFIPGRLGAVLDRAPGVVELSCRALVMAIVRLTSPYARVRDHPTTCRIPFHYLRNFDFAQKRYPFESAYAPARSLFHIAEREGIPWSYRGFPRANTRVRGVRRWVERELPTGPRFLYLHVSDLDATGHRWGPDADATDRELLRVDRELEAIVTAVRERLSPVGILLFGDHGMARVEHRIDVQSRLEQLDSRPGRDFLYFLDSTMVRFWFETNRSRRDISRCMANLPGVTLLDGDARRRLCADYSHRRFGDAIYLLDEGWIVHPSFYSRGEPPRGMHGYGPDAEGNHAAFVLSQGSWADRLPLARGDRHVMTDVWKSARWILEQGG